jgi:hypothetical protein
MAYLYVYTYDVPVRVVSDYECTVLSQLKSKICSAHV